MNRQSINKSYHKRWATIIVFIFIGLGFSANTLFAQARIKSKSGSNIIDEDKEKREMYLKQLLPLLSSDRTDKGRPSPLDETWLDWQRRTGELPPNFETMPSIPFLPDPLILEKDGVKIPVTTREQWMEKRQWIEKETKHWITGTFPPPPDNLQARIVEEKVQGPWTMRTVELRFGPNHRAKMTLDLMIPPGHGPFPVFMTQGKGSFEPGSRNWALTALKRGYIGCVYAGSDSRDDTEADDEDTDPYAVVWPEYDFTNLMRRAWGASRVIDYLYTLQFVDRGSIGITGHSRNGKQSLMAAAFDNRITAVVPSSGNTGEGTPWRYTSEKYDNETIRQITSNFPHWFHPRLRFFIGREHKLPIDQNLMLALVAPRGLMLSSSINEQQGNPWGFEQNFRSAQKVYQFLGADKNLGLRLRYHGHSTTGEDIDSFVDFFDHVFGRNTHKTDQPPRRFYYDYSFEKWLAMSYEYDTNPLDYPVKGISDLLVGIEGSAIINVEQWEQKKLAIKERIQWGLGEPTNTQSSPRRPRMAKNMERIAIGGQPDGGNYPGGNLYYPTDDDGNHITGKLPVIIYLHEYAYAHGYGRFMRELGVEESTSVIQGLVKSGFAVFAFDQIGFGTRVEEGTNFYRKHPHWSKMGKMVADTKAAVGMLADREDIDPERIYTAGYTLGATVGLYTAAIDERIAGVVSVGGFSPMRLDAEEKGTEGIRTWSHLHGLIPRLGFFVDEPLRTPYDFHEILASIAPRPVLIVAPTRDRDAIFEDVKACVEEARKVYQLYGAKDEIDLHAPDDYNRFSHEMQKYVYSWVKENF
jgi:dienelactone hydrolase